MEKMIPKIETEGYTVVEEFISAERCLELIDELPQIETSGTRTLLRHELFRGLVEEARNHAVISAVISNLVAIQCILFRKTQAHNWSLRLHRDAIIPVSGTGVWPSAGLKEGMSCVRPPASFLDRCLALRVSLDGAPEGDIEVIPGSHRMSGDFSNENRTAITVPRGGALLFHPRLAHASSKLEQVTYRRVLHYLFAPSTPPDSYQWYYAV